MDQIQEIALDQLYPSEGNRRVGGFDKAKLEQLAESIRAVGVQQPAVVRRLGPVGNDYELVAGERRWRAAKLAGLATLPCVVRELDDVAVIKIQTIENLQREDIHPLDEADGYARLLEHAGYDVEHLAGEVGRSISYVYQRLKLRDLVPEARELLVAGTISAGHAILIARLQPPQQQECLEHMQPRRWGGDGGIISVRALDDYIQRQILLDLSKASFKRDDAELVPAAGPCTTCPKRSGFQPALFADVCNGKKDYCTDPACFNSKLDALVARRRAELAEEKPLLVVSTEYGGSGNSDKKLAAGGVLTRYDWDEAKKSDDGAVRCLIVDGADRGRVTWGKERKRNVYGRYQKSAKEKASESAAREKARIDAATRRRLWDATMERAAKRLESEIPEALLRTIVDACFQRLWDDARDALVKAEGWERPEKKSGEFGKPWRAMGPKKIAAMTAPELRLFLFKICLASELLARGAWYSDRKDDVVEAAKLLGVDVGAIVAEVKAEASAAAVAKKARQAKKAKTAKPAKKAAGKPGAAGDVRRCRICGCTDGDCKQCIELTGAPCHWVEDDLCSACADHALPKPVRKRVKKDKVHA